MRKGTILLAIVFAFSAATAASAAKKMAKPDPAIQAQKDSQALFFDAFHPWAPTATMQHVKKGKKKKS